VGIVVSASTRTEPIPKYVSIAQTSLQQAIAYRLTTLFTIGLTFIWVFILYYVWKAAYSDQAVIEGFTWDEMRTYVVLAYAINALVGWRIGAQMMATIRSGEVVIELVRPLNYCGTQLARATGFAVVEGILSLIITVIVGLVFLDIEGPASPLMAALFILSLTIGFVSKALIVFAVSLLAFWTLNGTGLMWSQQAIVQVLSGTIVPIALLPGWLRLTAEVLPMRGIVSTPLTIYLGQAEGVQIVQLLALQVAWLVVLWIGGNWAWRRAFAAVETQGG
jgi:ABC-2 type transport system permease protein